MISIKCHNVKLVVVAILLCALVEIIDGRFAIYQDDLADSIPADESSIDRSVSIHEHYGEVPSNDLFHLTDPTYSDAARFEKRIIMLPRVGRRWLD